MLRSYLKTFQEIFYIERFSSSIGLLQRIDPRVKFGCILAFIVSAVAVRTITSLIVLLAVVVALCVLSKIPLRFFFLRTTIFIPIFAGILALPLPFITPGAPFAQVRIEGLVISATQEGIFRAVQFTFRVWVCVASSILLVLTTKFSRLIRAMEDFRFPRVLVTMTAVTYRFIFLFIGEAYRMTLAKESRTVTRQRWMENIRSLAKLIATLFIRAHERGERVYLAMTARAYAGTVKSMGRMECAQRDWIFAGSSLLACILTLSIEYLHLGGW